jgi:hypothetical protein
MNKCAKCDKSDFPVKDFFSYDLGNTDYEQDPSAWTPELLDRIEEAGLANIFEGYLCQITDPRDHNKNELFYLIRSTPAQKAAALAKAIKEVT